MFPLEVGFVGEDLSYGSLNKMPLGKCFLERYQARIQESMEEDQGELETKIETHVPRMPGNSMRDKIPSMCRLKHISYIYSATLRPLSWA